MLYSDQMEKNKLGAKQGIETTIMMGTQTRPLPNGRSLLCCGFWLTNSCLFFLMLLLERLVHMLKRPFWWFSSILMFSSATMSIHVLVEIHNTLGYTIYLRALYRVASKLFRLLLSWCDNDLHFWCECWLFRRKLSTRYPSLSSSSLSTQDRTWARARKLTCRVPKF